MNYDLCLDNSVWSVLERSMTTVPSPHVACIGAYTTWLTRAAGYGGISLLQHMIAAHSCALLRTYTRLNTHMYTQISTFNTSIHLFRRLYTYSDVYTPIQTSIHLFRCLHTLLHTYTHLHTHSLTHNIPIDAYTHPHLTIQTYTLTQAYTHR